MKTLKLKKLILCTGIAIATGALVLLSCHTVWAGCGGGGVPTNYPPTGTFDLADSDQGRVAGWARDPDTTTPINISIYRDGAPGAGGTFVGYAAADIYREDLPFEDKYHHFSYVLPNNSGIYDGQDHDIYIYAIDSSGRGPNILLNGCPKTIRDIAMPSGLTADISTPGAISLAWTDNAGNEDGYEVQWRTNEEDPWTVIADLAPDTESYSHTGIAGTKEHFYRIRAYHARDKFSNIVSVNLNWYEPTGTFDLADSGQGRVAGWARDPDTTTPIMISIWRDEPYPTGTHIGYATADLYRQGMPDGDKYHGFSYILPYDSGVYDNRDHDIYIYALDSSGSGPNVLLNGSPKTIHCQIKVETGQPYTVGVWYFTAWSYLNDFHAVNSAKSFVYGRKDLWGGVRDHVWGLNPWGIENPPGTEPVDYSNREPLIGFYDLMDQSIMDTHIRQAASRGLSYFAFYWYWDAENNRESSISTPIQTFISSPVKDKIKFILAPIVLENNGAEITLDIWTNNVVPYMVDNYISDPSYLTTVDGRPIIYAFKFGFNGELENATAAVASLRQYIQQELGKDPVILKMAQAVHTEGDLQYAVDILNLDGVGNFAFPANNAPELYADTAARWESDIMQQQQNFFHIPAATMGYDARPWYRVGYTWGDPDVPGNVNTINHNIGLTPEAFKDHLQNDVKPYLDQNAVNTSKILNIYAWNEWGEGGVIEPSYVYGYSYLDAIQEVFGLVPQAQAPPGSMNRAWFISQEVPETLSAGEQADVSITFKNTGETTWNYPDFKLGSKNPSSNDIWGVSRVYLDAGEYIYPGQEKTFTFTITAPTAPGTYNFEWRMVEELVEWFGDFSINKEITVPFTIAILPDTQAILGNIFDAQTQWIADNKDSHNIVFVLHEGDIVSDCSSDYQWNSARESMGILDTAGVPYALVVGNHDMGTAGNADTRDTSLFNTYFPVGRYNALQTFGGVFGEEPDKLDNSYHLFSAGGTDWLVLALEFGPRDQVLDWAKWVVSSHPNRRVIVVTHTYLYVDDRLHGFLPSHDTNPHSYGVADEPGGVNDGLEIWDKFIRKYNNISFVFNGHVCGDGTGRLVSTGDHGNKIYQMLANYQMLSNGGNGYLRLLEFNPGQNKVTVKTYSPYLGSYLTDEDNQFEFTDVDLGPPPQDTASPTIKRLTADNNPAEIIVLFNEEVEQESAEETANYSIDNGIAIYHASLSSDLDTVTLVTSPLTEGIVYTLTANNIKDRAAVPNTIAPDTEAAFINPLLFDDFNDGDMSGWTIVDEGEVSAPSDWSVFHNRLFQSSNISGVNRKGTFAYWDEINAFNWKNYILEATLHSTDNDGIGVMFYYKDPANYYKFDIDKERNFRKLFKMKDGIEITLADAAGGYTQDTDMDLQVIVTNGGITVILDGEDVFAGPVTDDTDPLLSGTVALYSWGSASLYFDNVLVTPAAN